MVPVGGAIIGSPSTEFIQAISSIYAGVLGIHQTAKAHIFQFIACGTIQFLSHFLFLRTSEYGTDSGFVHHSIVHG
jgi:hypothetical protein